jgi:hypothetical protein
MRILLGFVLGVALTIACVYEYDFSTGRVANGLAPTAADGRAPMVNWDVVGNTWQDFQANLRVKTEDLEKTVKRHVS